MTTPPPERSLNLNGTAGSVPWPAFIAAADLMTLAAPWRRDAACRFLGPADGETQVSRWYPDKTAGFDNQGALAKRICAGCPVWGDCLISALEANEEHGIHGGAGEARRRVLRRHMVAAQAAPAGPQRLLAWLVFGAALMAHLRSMDGCPEPGDRELLDVNGRAARHGTPGRYAKGCRCDPCSLAISLRGAVEKLGAADPGPAGDELAAWLDRTEAA